METELIAAGVRLSELAVKETAKIVDTKIKSYKEEKNLEKVKSNYEEIINELMLERNETIRIAQIYKSEVERIQISDEDLKSLNDFISSILNLGNISDPNKAKALQQSKDLISTDIFRVLQLLGFNYKEAVGKPLTELCANYISSLDKNKNNGNKNKK